MLFTCRLCKGYMERAEGSIRLLHFTMKTVMDANSLLILFNNFNLTTIHLSIVIL